MECAELLKYPIGSIIGVKRILVILKYEVINIYTITSWKDEEQEEKEEVVN